jgi:hypothetical protein
MRLFDLLKMNKDIENSLNEYIHKLEKYKTLKKGQLASVADDDLKTAVMSRMQEKFNEKRIDENEVMESLPIPCRYVYACCTVIDEINNGGLTQLFFNTSKRFVSTAQEGFSVIGDEDLSRIMKEAIRIYEKNEERLAKYNDGTVESFSASYKEKLFDEFDNEFVKRAIDFDSLLVCYIRKNENAFGD